MSDLNDAKCFFNDYICSQSHPALGAVFPSGKYIGYLMSEKGEDCIPFSGMFDQISVKGIIYTARTGNILNETRRPFPFHLSIDEKGFFGLSNTYVMESECRFWLKRTPAGNPVYQYIGGRITPKGILIALIISLPNTSDFLTYYSGFYLNRCCYFSDGSRDLP